MSLQAAIIDLDRSVRLTIGREATIRNNSQSPVDAVIEDISLSGCLFSAESDFVVDEIVSIGIPGIGAHRAKISRMDRPHYGCAFLSPITAADLQVSQVADTLVVAQFPLPISPKIIPNQNTVTSVEKLPLNLRVAIILGSSLALWAAILLLFKTFFA